MLTTRGNPVVILQKNTIKTSKHTDPKALKGKKRHLDKKQGAVDLKNKQKTINKMATVSL